MKIDNKKIKFINKILTTGINSEKEIQQIKLEDIINKPGIKMNDLKELLDLQTAIKDKNLFEYLLEDTPKDTQEKINS
ncbi:hypothetical protein [Varibaculum cambriense]|uniref:hypothetical protein n=1 Tax=Varibaculum cambriense TaxID=184870 RepID=UPI002556B5CE|nr:hypothetical protein [Varibaculum cambriense]MDK8275422.1 hypothetical protein [Varibaculum cambriense]